jgi:hypothetical protein
MKNLLIFLILSTIFVWLFCGKIAFTDLWGRAIDVLGFHKNFGDYPNVYLTVGEMAQPNVRVIAIQCGGIILFLAAISSLALLASAQNRYIGIKQDFIIIFSLWFIMMYFVNFKGMRFSECLILPLGIGFAWVMGERHWLTSGVLTLIIAGITIYNANMVALAFKPLMNSTWYDTLVKMDKELPKDAIINSWWDYGDWFTAVAHRRVIFDGQSQLGERAYDMAKVFLASDEDTALAILHKLNGNAKTYVVVDNSMVDKMGALSFIGCWDMEKLRRYRTHKDLESQLIPKKLVDEWLTKRLIYVNNNGQLSCAQELLGALFTRLYFQKGEPLKHFKLVMNVETPDTTVRTYEVIW